MKYIRSYGNRSPFVVTEQIIPQAVSEKYVRYTLAIGTKPLDLVVGQPITGCYHQIIVTNFLDRMNRLLVELIKNGMRFWVDGGTFWKYKFAVILLQKR